MSSTSVWVPLVVAALGIFGTLAAALCTQFLQKRRELEQQKEANLAAISERWLTDKQALYAEFIGTMEPWVRWTTTLRYSAGKLPRELIGPQLPDAATFVEVAQLLLARMELIASSDVTDAARGFWLWTGAASQGLAEANRTEFNRDEFMRGVKESYEECLSAMRHDLGIPVPPNRKARRTSDQVGL